MIYFHQEWYNGKGYPAGLKGEETPLSARVLSILDVYNALTTDRPYRKALTKEKVINILEERKGTQFDPDITDVFIKILREE